MGTRNWSSFLMRTLVLIAGAGLILETIHVLSISVTFHALPLDIRNVQNAQSLAGIAAGLFVGSLASLPNRKNRNRRIGRAIPSYWTNRINAIENLPRLDSITNLMLRHTDVR